MNTVYIDTLVCVNFFVDYLMLYTLRMMLRINTKLIRIIPGALFASITTLGVFLPFYSIAFSIFYRIISAMLVTFITFGKSNLKKLIIRTLCFIGISISYSGIVTLIWLMIKPQGVVIYNDVVYFDLSPIMLIVCTILAFISISLYERIKNKHKSRMQIKRVTILSDKCEYSFDSLVDTGCTVKEPFSGLPVIIAEKELLSNAKFPEDKQRIIPYNTLSGEGALKGFRPQSVKIDGKELKTGCYVALCEGKLNNETKSIMGLEITEGL